MNKGEPRELLCQRCNREYVVWYAPNELWNAVIRNNPTGDEGSQESFLCACCFMELAAERGYDPVWVVTDAFKYEDEMAELRTLRGHVAELQKRSEGA